MSDGKDVINFMIVSDEFREADGDDLMLLLAVRYALRGWTPSGPLPGRSSMTPDEIRARIGELGPGSLVAVVLDAAPPTHGEARAMEAEWLRATSPAGAAAIRAGTAVLPARYADDWIWEIGPKSFAAIEAAQARGRELVVMLPPIRAQALGGADAETAAQLAALEDGEAAYEAFISSLSYSLRCGDARVSVPALALADRPEAVVARLCRLLSADEAE